MKVICKNNISVNLGEFDLIIGEIYDVIDYDEYNYGILSISIIWTCPKELFVSLHEYRNEKIDKLLRE
jgi:hypothetical protein